MQLFTLAASMDGSKALDISSSLFVALMGIGIVFTGLICIVLICWLTSLFFKKAKAEPSVNQPAVPAPTTSASPAIPEAKRGEFIAAVSAAIAEDLGTDVEGIRITSVKKL